MKKSFIVLVFFILAVFVFVLGIGFGVLYQSEKGKAQAEAIYKALQSKAINSIVLYGQVSAINGREVTLSFQGNSSAVFVPETTEIRSAGTDVEKYLQGSLAKVKFEEIKIGDNLNMNARMSDDGTLQASSVMVLPEMKK